MACANTGAPVAAMTMVAVLITHYMLSELALQPQWEQRLWIIAAHEIAAGFAGVGHYAMVGMAHILLDFSDLEISDIGHMLARFLALGPCQHLGYAFHTAYDNDFILPVGEIFGIIWQVHHAWYVAVVQEVFEPALAGHVFHTGYLAVCQHALMFQLAESSHAHANHAWYSVPAAEAAIVL